MNDLTLKYDGRQKFSWAGDMIEIIEDWHFTIGSKEMVIPAGFVSDGGSVPRVLWSLIPRYGKPAQAYVLHDWLYRTGTLDRKTADWALIELARMNGVKPWRRDLIYPAVRLFGGFSYND